MILSKTDFNGLVLSEQIAYAHYTELFAKTSIKYNKVFYVVSTELEPLCFSGEVPKGFFTHRQFDNLEDAIEGFNYIQREAEKGNLVKVDYV